MHNIEKLKPTGLFTNYIYKAIPLAFDESMSYYETLCGLLSYLKDTVIPTVNNNADAIVEVQNLINNLQNYIDNYFENLDVQEEINNKLDEMAENGTLEEIITSYIQLKSILAFDDVADMKNATNLVDGSYAKTLGYHELNDGGEALYKIREITNLDVVDEMFIISLSDNTLIAELIYNDINVKQLGAKGDNVNDESTIIQNAINKSKNKGKVIIPDGQYMINTTLKTYENTFIEISDNGYLMLKNIDGIYLDGNSSIKGGTIICPSNYDKTAIKILPASNNKLDEKIGGLFNVHIKNTTSYSTDSVGIGCSFIDNYGNELTGITYLTINDCYIKGFEYGIKFVENTTKWITSLNIDNLKMVYCKNFIYTNMNKDFTGNKLTNLHLQIDKDNLDYVIYLNGHAEDNYFNIIEWDLDTSQNQNCIYLGSNSMNNKIEADKIYNYGYLKIISDNGINNYVTSAFIERDYLTRTNMKEIDLTELDNTKAYPVLFENMCNIKLWKYSETGAIYSYLYAYIDAVSSKAGSMRPSYYVRMSTPVSQQLIPKIQSNSSNKYVAVYLKGGFKYKFLDYNYEYQEENSREYFWSDELKNPYRVITTSYTSVGITYEPISLENSIPNGIFYEDNANIDLDKDSTPLTLS